MVNVLFTRNLDSNDIALAESVGISAVVHPLIRIQGLKWRTILVRYPNFWNVVSSARAVVFTSQNAVDALFSPVAMSDGADAGQELTSDGSHVDQLVTMLKKKPVYTVGETTADTLIEYGIMARFPEDYNGTTLAKMMLNDGVHTEVVHFCGNIRRPEFSEVMNQSGILVSEIEVYEKVGLKIQISGSIFSDYLEGIRAVAFYSPSAVEAFFEQGLAEGFSGDYFAIGSTTAAALKERGVQPMTPRAPTSELLIRYVGKTLASKEASK